MHDSERTRTQLFPCASKVNIPYVGASEDRGELDTRISNLEGISTKQSTVTGIRNNVVRNLGLDLSFGEDVVRERCFHLLPYDDKYFYEAIDPSNIIKVPSKSSAPIGRHDRRGTDTRHMPCHIRKKSGNKQLKPLKQKIMQKALEMHKTALLKTEPSNKESQPVFLTETRTEDCERVSDDREHKTKKDWDEYLLSSISRNTAFWLVTERLPTNESQDRLLKTLNKWYGPTAPVGTAELVSDEISEVEFQIGKKEEVKEEEVKWTRKEDVLLEELGIKKSAGATDPYSDKNNAAFYRLPAGMRKEKKSQDETYGAVNKTAANIEVKQRESTPPPSLLDFINPEVGEKLFKTDNLFEQEWLSGINQIRHADDNSVIVMETKNQYRKVLQPEYPPFPEGWFPEMVDEAKLMKTGKKLEKGLHRWKALPEIIDDRMEGLQVGPGNLDNRKSTETDSNKYVKKNASLMKIVEDWQNKWYLTQRFADSTPDDLIRDMLDLHPHIRLKAIITCARAIDYRPPKDENGIKIGDAEEPAAVEKLPPKVFKAIEFCLDDGHIRVRIASAITLYTLGRANEKALAVLRTALNDENSVDRWAAAQCLAHHGVCDSDVIGELIHQLLHSEDIIKHEQSTHLLTKLSLDINNSSLVYSMLAEQLNSSSWKHKIIACKTIPTMTGEVTKDPVFPHLHPDGGIPSRDLVNKLADLMWNDWHADVRIAAAQCLGKTGHGKDVHDDLRSKLLDNNERVRTEAVNKVGHLGIMTAKLMPSFLKCFQDEYVTVRMEVCISCGNLGIQDEQIVDKLTTLASYDPIWKVKALAIQALGKIGILNPQIQECLLWAIRYEKEPAVRAEACHTLFELKVKDSVTAEILQDRYLVESSPIVREEIALALSMFGISPTEDMDTVTQIKEEVRKLCTLSNISTQILENEGKAEHQHDLKRLIYKQQTKDRKKTPKSADSVRSGRKSVIQKSVVHSPAALSTKLGEISRSAKLTKTPPVSSPVAATKTPNGLTKTPTPSTPTKHSKTPPTTDPEKETNEPSPIPTPTEFFNEDVETREDDRQILKISTEAPPLLDQRELTKITEKSEMTKSSVMEVSSRPSTSGENESVLSVLTRPSTMESEFSLRPSTRSGSRSMTFVGSTPGFDEEVYRESTKSSLHDESVSRMKLMVTPKPSSSRRGIKSRRGTAGKRLKFHYDMPSDDIDGLDLERVPTTLVQLYEDADHPERGPPVESVTPANPPTKETNTCTEENDPLANESVPQDFEPVSEQDYADESKTEIVLSQSEV